MKRYLVPVTIAAIGISMFVIGSTQAAPYEPEPPVAEPIDDVQPIYHEPGTFELAPLTTTDGTELIYHEPGTFTTTPQSDQCWNPGPAGEVLQSGEFVIFEDGRTWGTHSIGGMNCGPADTPFPEAPEPAAATAPECKP